MNPIFISYRRDDTGPFALKLYDKIASRRKIPKPYLDKRGTQAGQEFPRVLIDKLNNSSALVALIGPQWASIRDERGRRRLHTKGDYVAQEIKRALKRGILIIPVLVGGAKIPQLGDLPVSLRPLCKLQVLDAADLTLTQCVEVILNRVAEEGHHLSVQQRSKYSGEDKNGTKWWKWWVWLAGSREQLKRVDSVDYHLHRPTYEDPIRKVTDPKSKFQFESESYDTFNLKVIVYQGTRRKTVIYHELVLR